MGGKQSHEIKMTENENVTDQESFMANIRKGMKNSKKIKGLAKLMTIKEKQAKEESQAYYTQEEDKHETDKTNQQLLKSMFKRMDPMVMQAIGEVKGDVQVSFKYDFNRQLLLIKVIRCRDLDPKDVRGKTADPFVRMFLHPDFESQGERKTQVIKRTLAPTFNEIFSFELSEVSIPDTSLVVQVCDFDEMVKHDVLGEAIISLKKFNFLESPVHTAWYSLQLETDLKISGELFVTIVYQLPQTLLVTIHRGSTITQRDSDRKPDALVKASIPGIPVVHKTKPVESTRDPEWEETFEFPIPQEEFNFRYIVFNVLDNGADSTSDESLGQVVIDLMNFDPEKGYHGSFILSDLKNHERLRNKMSQKATVQEFREALMAHSFFKHPKFLFQKHSGNKVITVTSRKAGSNAKIRLVDGIPVY